MKPATEELLAGADVKPGGAATKGANEARPAGIADPLWTRARQVADHAVDHLLSIQDEKGWWKGNLQTNVTMDAEDLMLRCFLGILEPTQTAEAARWIRSQQREDGTWANFHEGPADLSTTVEAYVALRLAGDDPAEDHMRAARDFVLSS